MKLDSKIPLVRSCLIAFAVAACGGPSFFRVDPQRSIPELTAEALAASPPVEEGDFRPSDLVDITTIDSSVRLDTRYATNRNFLGEPVYSSARALLQRPAAEALGRVSAALRERGFGLTVFDAYRPWYVTKIFWDATPPEQRDFVANPANGSRHNRGSAVDLSMHSLDTGELVPMPSLYDEFTERAHSQYSGGTAEERANRELLRTMMEAEGFEVYELEWWHFDFADWRSYRIQNVLFEQIESDS